MDDIFVTYVILFMHVVNPAFTLMDYNVRPVRAHLVDEFLESETIRLLDWLTRSPDLNPREHI